jgi:hypothetical protein
MLDQAYEASRWIRLPVGAPHNYPATIPSMNSASMSVECGSVAPRMPESTRGGSSPLRQRSSPLRHSPGIVEGSAQQHLDVGIEAA